MSMNPPAGCPFHNMMNQVEDIQEFSNPPPACPFHNKMDEFQQQIVNATTDKILTENNCCPHRKSAKGQQELADEDEDRFQMAKFIIDEIFDDSDSEFDSDSEGLAPPKLEDHDMEKHMLRRKIAKSAVKAVEEYSRFNKVSGKTSTALHSMIKKIREAKGDYSSPHCSEIFRRDYLEKSLNVAREKSKKLRRQATVAYMKHKLGDSEISTAINSDGSVSPSSNDEDLEVPAEGLHIVENEESLCLSPPSSPSHVSRTDSVNSRTSYQEKRRQFQSRRFTPALSKIFDHPHENFDAEVLHELKLDDSNGMDLEKAIEMGVAADVPGVAKSTLTTAKKKLKMCEEKKFSKKTPYKGNMGIKCVEHLKDTRWTNVALAIRESIYDDEFYDDGTYGPMFVRLAFHSTGTFDAKKMMGGLQGACIRMKPESKDAHNKFWKAPFARLENCVKKKFPWVSYADLFCLSAYVAIECANGPIIKFTPGRLDSNGKELEDKNGNPTGIMSCPMRPGLLPTPEVGNLKGPVSELKKETIELELKEVAKDVREIFNRIGVTERQTVCLISGGHTFGRAHREISGYAGPWTETPGTFTNLYAKTLYEWDDWKLVDKHMTDKSGDLITGVKPKGIRKQYVNKNGEGSLMMFVSDMALKHDPEYCKYLKMYAEDEDLLKKDFGEAFKLLTELGFTKELGGIGPLPLTLKEKAQKMFFKIAHNCCAPQHN